MEIVQSRKDYPEFKRYRIISKTLLSQGANKNYVAEGLSGLDSDKAWEMRETLLSQGADKGWVAIGLAGLDSDKAWEMRETFLSQGANKDWVARGI